MEEINPRQKQQVAIQNLLVPNPYRRPEWSYLYRGPGLSPPGSDMIELLEKVDVPLIFDSVRQIVETYQGERLLEPEFGSRVRELIFEPISTLFEQKVYSYLTAAVQKYEPRARITAVEFRYADNSVFIIYTMDVQQLGYTAQGTMKIPRMSQ
jgi:phage baseplate assembly protein W